MKKIDFLTLIIGVILLVVSLSGCGSQPEVLEENPTDNIVFELEKVWSGQTGCLGVHHYRDTTTNIMYLYDSGFKSGGYTVMPDPETGLPLTYDRYLEIYTVKEN